MDLGLTLLGQMITFAIFVWFTMKFVWPILAQALEERKKQIADGLAAAEKGHQTLELAKKQVKEELRKAKERYNEVIATANIQALHLIEEAKREAQQERDNILMHGRAIVQQELSQAQAELQTRVADIVVLGAEKILARSINAADHQILLDKLAKELAG